MNGLDFGTAIGLIKGLGSPDPAVIESAVSDWLDDHPEATTTVQDGSITKAKLDSNLQGTVDDVANLKSEMNLADDAIYYTSQKTAASSSNGWRLNDSNGLCHSDNGYKLVKYTVTAGDLVKVVSDDKWQFQNSSSVPSSGTSNRVGDTTYGVGKFIMTVPTGATYLIVSTPTNGIAAAYGVRTVKEETNGLAINTSDRFNLIEGDYYTNKFDKDHITNGYFNSDGSITSSSSWAITDYLPVRPGDTVRIVNNGSLLSISNATIGTYDAEKTWLGLATHVDNPFTIPQNAQYRYIRYPFSISGVDTSKITVTINDTTLYTIPPTFHAQDSVFHLIDDNEEEQGHINGIYACSYFNSVPEQITVYTGGFLQNNGTVGTVSDTRYMYTDYIEIVSTAYKVTVSAGSTPYGVCFYDKNKDFISYDLHTNAVVDYVDVTLTIPESARYFRLSSFKTTPSTRKAIVINDLYYFVSENAGNNYIGKKCAQLGDSITWYDGHTQTIDGQTVTVKGYASYLREKGIVVDNYGVSGACITNLSSYTDVCETVDSVDFTEYDLCIIAAGVNDYDFWNSPIGDFTNGSFDKGIFTQAYQYIIETILAQNKTIKIVLCTPLQETHKTTANTQGNVLKDYADRIKEIGAYYSLPVLDLYSEGGLNKINMATLTIDNLHPNNDGYELVCEHSFVPFVISH